MLAHLVEHRALHRKDAPVGPLWSVRAAEHVERLLVVVGVGECASVGAEKFHVLRMRDRGRFEHGGGLRALADIAQRAAHRLPGGADLLDGPFEVFGDDADCFCDC